MSDDRKQRQLAQHGKRESQYLRLRRTKIGLEEFKTVKVIGKGAFGEVGDFLACATASCLIKMPTYPRYDWCRRLIRGKSTL